MNERIIVQLENELALLKSSEEKQKHVYAMKRLLDLLDDEAVKETKTEVQTEPYPVVSRKIITQQEEDKAGGHGGDIFDF